MRRRPPRWTPGFDEVFEGRRLGSVRNVRRANHKLGLAQIDRPQRPGAFAGVVHVNQFRPHQSRSRAGIWRSRRTLWHRPAKSARLGCPHTWRRATKGRGRCCSRIRLRWDARRQPSIEKRLADGTHFLQGPGIRQLSPKAGVRGTLGQEDVVGSSLGPMVEKAADALGIRFESPLGAKQRSRRWRAVRHPPERGANFAL